MKCELCGSEVKVVGHTTMHYEPVAKSLIEIRDEMADSFAINSGYQTTYDRMRLHDGYRAGFDAAFTIAKDERSRLLDGSST
jgi:hypothetical protein